MQEQMPPTSISRAEAQTLLARMNDLTRMFQGITDGTIKIADGQPLVTKDGRGDGRVRQFVPDDRLARTMGDVKEPKRQRKARNLQPRSAYSLKQIKTPTQLREVQNLAPAGSAIVIYLATHPKATVPELVTQLDLKRKTVANHLSLLKQKDLVESENV